MLAITPAFTKADSSSSSSSSKEIAPRNIKCSIEPGRRVIFAEPCSSKSGQAARMTPDHGLAGPRGGFTASADYWLVA
jgi:hypothetical protein